MDLLEELVLIIFKKDLANLACLNKYYNELLRDRLREVCNLKVGKFHSIYGYYKITDKIEEDYPYLVITEKRSLYVYCDNIIPFCRMFGFRSFRPIFTNATMRAPIREISHGSDMQFKDIKLLYKGTRSKRLHSGLLVNDEEVFINDGTTVHVYESPRFIKLRQRELMSGCL